MLNSRRKIHTVFTIIQLNIKPNVNIFQVEIRERLKTKNKKQKTKQNKTKKKAATTTAIFS